MYYDRADQLQYDLDHWPIRTGIDTETMPNQPSKRRLWKAIDVKKLTETITEHLATPWDLSGAAPR